MREGKMELCKIVDEHEIAEGTLTRMVGVPPLRWQVGVTGVITSPSLVAVEDPQAARDRDLGAAVRKALADWDEAGGSCGHVIKALRSIAVREPVWSLDVRVCRAIADALEKELSGDAR